MGKKEIIFLTQKDGAGIGQPQAGTYAGIFLADVVEKGLMEWKMRGGVTAAEAEPKGLDWKIGDRAEVEEFHRFEDDCIGLFRGTEAEFTAFVATMNDVDEAIKFTSEIDFVNNKVNFLDTTVHLTKEGLFTTDLYVKPNTLNQYLSPMSAHPGSVTRASVYSLALRLRRICSEEDFFEARVKELTQKLLDRKYKKNIIDPGVQRAREVSRSDALKKVEKVDHKEDGRQHRLIVEYDRRSSPALGEILRNNYEAACYRDARLKKLIPNVPKPVFTRGRNLKQLLCRAKLPKANLGNRRASDRNNKNGVSRCNKGNGRKQCTACPYLTKYPNQLVKSIKIESSGETIKIEDPINCKTKSFIYALQSDKHPKQYGGQSGKTVAQRSLQRAGDIENERLDKSIPAHFKETGSTKTNLVMTPVKVIRSRNPWIRLHYEREFINKHHFMEGGINRML